MSVAPVGNRHVKLRRHFPARLSEVDLFCLTLRAVLALTPWQGKAFAVELIVRELLNNAVLHGCQSDEHLSIRVWLTLTGQELVIRVADPGRGFDWRQSPAASPHAESGRGVGLLLSLCDTVRFNARGNVVTIRRRLVD